MNQGDPFPRRRILVAYLQVVLAGLLWATSGPFSVLLHRLGVAPETVALLRPAIGALFLVLIVLALPSGRRPAIPRGRTLAALTLGGGAIVATFHLAFQLSTQAIGVPATVALLYLAPALVLVGSAILLAEPLTPARIGLAVLSVIGVWMTALGARGEAIALTPTGIAWGVLSGVGYASYILFGKGFGPRLGPLVPLVWSTAGGAALLAAAWAVTARPLHLPEEATTWGILLGFGFLTVTASSLLLFRAMETLDAGRAAIGTTVEPLAAALLATLLLGQVLTLGGWVGLTLLLIGVVGAYVLPSPTVSGSAAPGSPLRPRPPRDSGS